MAFPETAFDAVTAFYSMTHVPSEEHASLFAKIYSWLRPGGYFLLTLSAPGETNGVQDEFIGVPMFFSGFSPRREPDPAVLRWVLAACR